MEAEDSSTAVGAVGLGAIGVGDLQIHVHRVPLLPGDGGEDDVIARAGVLGGRAVVLRVEIEPALMFAVVCGTGLVHVGDPHGGAGEGGGDGEAGPADEGGPILPEAHGVVSAVGGAQRTVADEHAQGVAGGHVEKVAVYAAHHAVALGLQRLGHGGKGLLAQKLVPINHHGVDALAGRIGDIALCAQIGFGIAPKDLADELGTGSQLHGPAM